MNGFSLKSLYPVIYKMQFAYIINIIVNKGFNAFNNFTKINNFRLFYKQNRRFFCPVHKKMKGGKTVKI